MIDKSEIMEFSREFGLRANVVEKDYVLGWMLAGIFNHPVIESSWVFKGGTCLKKCFFETYRFSEDLDFTLSESNHLDQEFLVSCFKEIAQWVYNETGIEIPQDLIRFDVYRNKRGSMSAEGRIGYRGPMQPSGDLPRIKLDLTPAGSIFLPELTRRSDGYDVFKSATHRSSSKRQSFGPKYVIECPYCSKKFNRKKMNTRLNPHKDKNGYPCSGRNGYLVDTKY
ncbi:MAG: nucleotidyl transferase AbiEii/AbiGii toxin family protein [Desulfobacterales bacterium]